MTNVAHLHIYQGQDHQWYWRAQARNGETVAQGEAHTRKNDAVRAATHVFPGTPILIHQEEQAE